MAIKPLTIEQLRNTCDPAPQFEFETTAELGTTNGIFGQPRGIRALEFGIGIRSRGYNIYVLGETGTGRTTAIQRYLTDRTRHQPTPDDWIYVHNFKIPHQPRAIEFPAGQGPQFKKQMGELVASLKDDLPRAFATDEYNAEVDMVADRVEIKQSLLMRDLERKAQSADFRIIRTASGLTVTPVVDGEVMTAEQFTALSLDAQAKLDEMQQKLEESLEETLKRTRQIKLDAKRELDELDRRVARQAIALQVEALRDMYRDHEEVLLYLSEVHDDVLDSLDDFRPDPQKPDYEPDLSRYEVNIFVDNSRTEGAPVIIESHPNYQNLLGRIEYEMRSGMMYTHFGNIKPGSLHQANGGYLVMEAIDLLSDHYAWDELKRSIKSGTIELQPTSTLDGAGHVLAKSIDPEPIPLDIKVIVLGGAGLYYNLYEQDEDFNELFKVKADFSTEMPRDFEHEMQYAHFIATRCHEEELKHFDASAVARVVEYGSELSEHQNKLSARFGIIADLVREACFWTIERGADIVTAADVQRALDERVFRSNKIETLIDQEIDEGMIMIATEGKMVGQVNALSVIDMGDYAFGRPSRITARTYAGSGGVVHIERETDMADSIHNKGVLTMVGYLGGQYAQDTPLSFSSSITFEQNYAGVGGDSASSAELYALLSSLSQVPLKQGIAVTGSINQRGEIQPIGGATEKIEGFYRVCKYRGSNGEQGVIIPTANVNELMLHHDVLCAVQAGEFKIWAIDSVDQGLEILAGGRAGKRRTDGSFAASTLHGKVQVQLQRMSSKDDDDDEDDD